MFWRRKSDGFDWHKHVRTTIKLRREARRQRVDDAVDLAVGGIKGAGRASVAVGNNGLEALNRSVIAPVALIGRGLAAVFAWIAGALTWMFAMLARPLEPAGRMMERRGLAPMLGLVAVVAGLLGLGRAKVEGWDPIALALCGSAVVLLGLLVLPPLVTGRGPSLLAAIGPRMNALWERVPQVSGIPTAVQKGIAGSLALVLVVGAGWIGLRAIGGVAAPSLSSLPGFSRPVLEGLAHPLSGDTLRIGAQAVKLSGIEAPAMDQQCGGQGREPRWRCGEAARTQLRELVRGKAVRCEIAGAGGKGVVPGNCKIGLKDIAAELVSRGHVFAQQGLFSSYGSLEQDARNGRRGVWRGSAERPEEYRARLWETAKKSSPQGCPIKGQVSRNERTYVVPWSPKYTKVRIRPDRGERWFCSEQEAQAAGWRPLRAS